MKKRWLISIIGFGIFLIATSFIIYYMSIPQAFGVQRETIGLFDISYRDGTPRNYHLSEYNITKVWIRLTIYGAYGNTWANRGEIYLNVSTGTIDIYLFDDVNYMNWKEKQPYNATLETQDTGTATIPFKLYDKESSYQILVLVNDSPNLKDVIVGGKIWLDSHYSTWWRGISSFFFWSGITITALGGIITFNTKYFKEKK